MFSKTVYAADYNFTTGELRGSYEGSYLIQVEVNGATKYATQSAGETEFYVQLDPFLSADEIVIKLASTESSSLSKYDTVNVYNVCTHEDVEESVPFQEEYRDNANELIGYSKVVQEGANGVKIVTYRVCDGKREYMSERITVEPTPKIIERGTKINIEEKVVTEIEPIPYSTVYEDDASLNQGEQQIKKDGEAGSKKVTYLETYENGVLKSRTKTNEEIMKEPVNQVVLRGTKEVTKSGNSFLKTLSVNGATLSPEFNKNTTAYSLNLKSEVKELAFSGTVDDSKATAIGFETVSVDKKTHSIVVTAENGTQTTYTFRWIVSDSSFVFDGQELVYDGSLLNAQSAFVKKEYEIKGNKYILYEDKDSHKIIGLKNQFNQSAFYLYDLNLGVLGQFNPIVINKVTYNQAKLTELTPLLVEKYQLEYVTVGDLNIPGYKVNKEGYENKVIIALQDLTGKIGFYEYDATTKSVKLIQVGSNLTEEIIASYLGLNADKKGTESGNVDFVMVGLLGSLLVALGVLGAIILKRKKELNSNS